MSKQLLPHQQRVVDEKVSLDEKIASLDKFLVSDVFKTIGPQDQHLLKLQHVHMRNYSYVLGKRIELFG